MKTECSDSPTDGPRIRLRLGLSKDRRRKLEALAKQEGVTPQQCATALIEKGIEDGSLLRSIKQRLFSEAVLSA